MAGWAAGVFTRARNWVNDKNGAINPQAALFDQEDDNFASGLNNCVTKDGLNKPSATMDWNTQILKSVGNPLFNAQRLTSAQSLSSSTVNTLIFNSENIDTGAGFDSATGIFTAPVAGQYVFSTSLSLQNNASGSWALNGIYLSRNNATAAGSSRFDCASGVASGALLSAGGNAFIATGSVVVVMAISDTMRLKVDLGVGGGAGNTVLNVGSTFSGYMLG